MHQTNLGFKQCLQIKKNIILPGDGIGPEVVGETKKIIDWFNKKKSLDFKIDEGSYWRRCY